MRVDEHLNDHCILVTPTVIVDFVRNGYPTRAKAKPSAHFIRKHSCNHYKFYA